MRSLFRILLRLVVAALAWMGWSDVRAAEPQPPAGRVDEVFAAYAKPGSPGCALAVIQREKVVYERGYGSASLEHGVAITPRTVFDLGSTSKQFTAAAILLLVQDGRLSLDDDVRKHVPEVPDYGTPITIRHLLHHTSGLRDYIELMVLGGLQYEDWTTDRDALAALSRQRALSFQPGEEHSYSNSGYFLLSVIVERASGKSLRDFARERIFAPLGMASTEVLNDHTRVVPGRATGYAPRPDGGFGVSMSNWEQTGDGAVQSTVLDLAKWDQNFYTPKVGGDWLVEELQKTGTLNDGQAFPYARGLAVDRYRGLRRVRHGGSWAGYRAELLRFPDERLSVATLCNLASANPSALALKVAELYLAGRLAPPEAPPPAPTASAAKVDPTRYQGLYWSEEAGLVRRVVAREGKLLYQRAPGNETEMVPLGEDRFTMAGAPPGTELVFSTPEVGGGRRLEARSPGTPTMRLEAAEPFSPTAGELAAFAGAFASDELDTTSHLTVVEGKLRLQLERGAPLDLEPVLADIFRHPELGLVRFSRDDEHGVSGFEISAGRAQNLRFTRLAAGRVP